MEIDGVQIGRQRTPGSEEELASVMREASDSGRSVIPVGCATRLHLGNPPRSADLAVYTGRLNGIVEYEPGNLTVSVLAGTPLRDLQATLRAQHQFLPLDPPHLDRSSVGGIVACNDSGPIRFRYGTVRDMLIGTRIVHADGSRTKAGGKLVKNVTGYDMCKLYTGSLGTLGILTELTFKVQPLPEAIATVSVSYPSLPAALEATQACLRADLMPDAIEAWNRKAYESLAGEEVVAPWVLLVRFGDADAAVRWQVDRLRKMAPGNGGEVLNALGTEESEEFWHRAARARENAGSGEELLLKCSVLHHSAADTGRRMGEMGERLRARLLLFCHAGTCILYGRYEWAGGECNADDLRREIADLRRHCVSAGGHLVVEKIRPGWKQGLDVWGYQAPALDLMRRIKTQFDPKDILNPGRFVGEI